MKASFAPMMAFLVCVAFLAWSTTVDAVSLKAMPAAGGLPPGTQYNGLEAPVIEMGPAEGEGEAGADMENDDLAKIASIFAKEPAAASGGGGDDMEMFGGGVDPLAPCDDAAAAAGAAPVDGAAASLPVESASAPEAVTTTATTATAAEGAAAAAPGATEVAVADTAGESAEGAQLGQQIQVLEDLISHATQISELIPDKQTKLEDLRTRYVSITAAAKKAAMAKKLEGQANILDTINAQMEAVAANVKQLEEAKKKVEQEMAKIKSEGEGYEDGGANAEATGSASGSATPAFLF